MGYEVIDIKILPGSWADQNGPVEQAAGQKAGPAHWEDDGMQGSQYIALGVVGL